MPAFLKTIVIITLAIDWLQANAQAPSIEWQRVTGGSAHEYATAVCATPDGGYVMTVSSALADTDFPVNYGQDDCWVVKTDSMGNVAWKTHVGGTETDHAKAIVAVKGGGYAIAGYTASPDNDVTGKHGAGATTDYWLVRLDENGKFLWQKCYGGSDYDYANAIDVTPDGGFIIAGTAASDNGNVTGNHGNGDCWIIKTDANGNIDWQRSLGGVNPDVANDVNTEADGSFVVVGFSFSADGDVNVNNRSGNVWMFKLSASGVLQWQRSFGGALTDYGQQVIRTAGGDYVIAAYSYSDDFGNHGSSDYYIIKTDSLGNVKWQHCFGGSGTDQPEAIIETAGGGFVIAGTTSSTGGDVGANHGFSDGWVMRLNASGEMLWQKIIGGSRPDMFNGLVAAAGGGIILVGGNESGDGDLAGYNGVFTNVWMLKLGCEPVMSSVSISSPSAMFCSGGNAVFTASVVNGGNAPFFQWYKNNVKVGEGSASYEDASPANGDSIYCLLTSDIACALTNKVRSNTVGIVISTKIVPAVSVSVAGTTVCRGSQVLFVAISAGADSNVFNWFVNSRSYPVNSDSFYTSDLADGDSVYVQMTSNGYCTVNTPVNSNVLLMKVMDGALPAIHITVSDTLICAGEIVNFMANASGSFNGIYDWKINNISTGVSETVYTTGALHNNDVVSCLLSSNNGCAAQVPSNNIIIRMHDAPTVLCMADTTISRGTGITLHAIVQGDMVTGQWSPAVNIQNGNSIDNAIVNPLQNTVYRLTVTAANGCTAYDEVLVKVKENSLLPNAFSPNGDGINDKWQLPPGYDCDKCFVKVFDRYGNTVFSSKGYHQFWDGTCNGKPVPAGVYYYYIKNSMQPLPLTGSLTVIR